ncbi:MAG: hypothetical protein KGJ09_02760 [Candidatus Omnitrophica bacterium]|nr:hypothetical protein [Candidatus Omnitrophota bacterium]MDE2008981.1 hypothetical protein [Candidatus Omnitrophota bacterium]MDE2214505.1 hypothetical protein [Candidatus Omnitrophota bacterium]MDE2230823.1 hypothetical protein [Candidatus Omnitrophota bacterium]
MGKFVNLSLLLFLLVFSGCAFRPTTDYIGRVDHPYDREINAGMQKVSGAVVYVLKKNGWSIAEESLPSIYERNERYDHGVYNTLLIMTGIKRHFHVFCFSYTHLNVFIYSFGHSSEVEVRYEAVTPLVRQFISTHNDKMVNGILDAIEQEADR